MFNYANKNYINFNNIDSYNKTFNLIICPRFAGKTVQTIYIKLFKTIVNNKGSVLIVKRYDNEVSKNTVESIETYINTFLPENKKIEFVEVAGTKNSVMTFKIRQNNHTFKNNIMMIWLGRTQKLKQLVINNVRNVIFDEYCIDPNTEKYQTNEFEKIYQLYGTLARFTTQKIKFYFCGNPYSRYNPFTNFFKVDLSKMKPGELIVGKSYTVWCYQLTPQRIEELKTNYDFCNNEYDNFTLEGNYLLDNKLTMISQKRLEYTKLGYYIYYNNSFYAVFQSYYINFYEIKKPYKNSKKTVYTLNILDCAQNPEYVLINNENKIVFEYLKRSINSNKVLYNSIKGIIDIKEIYSKI